MELRSVETDGTAVQVGDLTVTPVARGLAATLARRRFSFGVVRMWPSRIVVEDTNGVTSSLPVPDIETRLRLGIGLGVVLLILMLRRRKNRDG